MKQENLQSKVNRYLRKLVKEGVLMRTHSVRAGEYLVFYDLLPNEVDPGERRSYGGVTTSSFMGKFEVEVEYEDGKTEIIR